MSDLMRQLDASGFVHLREPSSWPAFVGLARELGELVLESDIRIDPERASKALKPEELRFHNDSPEVAFIGWHCVEQDPVDGASLLLDTAEIAERFSAAELEVLRTIDLQYPDLGRHDPDRGVFAYRQAPLLSAPGFRHQVYYAPWHRRLDSYDGEQLRLLARFEEWLEERERTAQIRIRLAPGESLLIDNRRMLHGRAALTPDSRRLLKRIWIRPVPAA